MIVKKLQNFGNRIQVCLLAGIGFYSEDNESGRRSWQPVVLYHSGLASPA